MNVVYFTCLLCGPQLCLAAHVRVETGGRSGDATVRVPCGQCGTDTVREQVDDTTAVALAMAGALVVQHDRIGEPEIEAFADQLERLDGGQVMAELTER